VSDTRQIGDIAFGKEEPALAAPPGDLRYSVKLFREMSNQPSIMCLPEPKNRLTKWLKENTGLTLDENLVTVEDYTASNRFPPSLWMKNCMFSFYDNRRSA
jgi:hypothetical protein